ncbi:MAG: hypothetical protein ABI851_13000 [Saprospiraceae bacterium]
MKNQILFSVLSLCVSVSSFAQDPEKDVKKADKLVGLYLLDPKSSKDKLVEAKTIIDVASKDTSVSNTYKTNLVKGKVYNELAAMDNAAMVINPKAKMAYDDAALIAFQSLEKAVAVAAKSYEKKDALSILQECSQYLNNFGSFSYNQKKFVSAYKNFEAVLKINQLLKDNGQKAILQSQDDINKQKYIVAVCALSAFEEDVSTKYFEELEMENYNDTTNAGAVVYESLYNYYVKSDSVKAEKYLGLGRTKFPNESNLLFAEINYYVKKGRLTELIDKLKLAISKEPNNLSIYATLGNVYDNLCQKEWEAGNMVKGDEYQNESNKYYDIVLEKAPDNANALYSKGALYYNRAALVSKEANKLANDYTKEGTRKYNEKKAEMDSYFDKALPFLEKADKIESNDVNTLIALKEIYAKKGMFDKSNAVKARLEAMKK